MDLDLEADLGIDSIKRVEILGPSRGLASSDQDKMQETMEQLIKAKTLHGIMGFINAILLSPQGDQCGEAVLEQEKMPAVQASEMEPKESLWSLAACR